MAIILVGAGGFIGSVMRYLMAGWLYRILDKPGFPVGTLTVNIVGCLLIGFFGGIADHRRIFNQEIRLFLFIGILGGFTTFSTFAYETSVLLRGGQVWLSWINVGLEVFLGLGAVWAGTSFARVF